MGIIDNLVSWWDLEEASGSRVDAHGDNDLTPSGSPSNATGIVGNCLNNTNTSLDKLYITDALQSGLDITGDQTIAFWLKHKDSNPRASNDDIINKYGSSGTKSYRILMSDNGIYFFHYDGTTQRTPHWNINPAQNTWHSYVFVLDVSANTVEFFYDNVSQGTGTIGSQTQNSDKPVTVGAWPEGTSNNLNGYLDSLCVCGSAWGTDERAEYWNSGAGVAYEDIAGSITPPTVTTNAATSIDYDNAQMNGAITDVGDENADTRGFVYGTTQQSAPGDVAPASAGYDNYVTQTGDYGVGSFNSMTANYDEATTVYFRAWAHNSGGYVYGDELSFTTLEHAYAISGLVTLGGTPVSGATVRCIAESTNTCETQQTTDVNGAYTFEDLDVAETYHVCVEYIDGETTYYTYSYHDITPYDASA